MNEDEIMIRAREAAITELRNPVAYDIIGIRAGRHDEMFGITPAARALRDLSKPLDELRPVDPDLIEARRIAVEMVGKYHAARDERLPEIKAGRGDQYWETEMALAAIKRGRELQREQSQ